LKRPSYSAGGNGEDHDLRTTEIKSYRDSISIYKLGMVLVIPTRLEAIGGRIMVQDLLQAKT
jgi:hypothetical protein